MRRSALSRTETIRLIALAAVGFLLVAGQASGVADAHSPRNTWTPVHWAADAQYRIGYLGGSVPNTSTVRDSIHASARTWSNVSGSQFDFIWSGLQDSSWLFYGGACQSGFKGAVLVVAHNEPDHLGVESTCSSGSTMVRSVIRMDADRPSTRPWNLGAGSPSQNAFDFRSVLTHEFGHALGHIHFASTDSSTACGDIDRHTMCPNTPPGSSHLRTLESHELYVVLARYG